MSEHRTAASCDENASQRRSQSWRTGQGISDGLVQQLTEPFQTEVRSGCFVLTGLRLNRAAFVGKLASKVEPPAHACLQAGASGKFSKPIYCALTKPMSGYIFQGASFCTRAKNAKNANGPIVSLRRILPNGDRMFDENLERRQHLPVFFPFPHSWPRLDTVDPIFSSVSPCPTPADSEMFHTNTWG